MLEELLKEEPESKCMMNWKAILIVGCLFSLAVYKLALSRILGTDISGDFEGIGDMIRKLEKGDPMRAGQYKEWRISLEQN